MCNHPCRFRNRDHECLRISGGRNEAMFFIESFGVFGECADQDSSYSRDLRRLQSAQYCVEEEIRADSTAL